MIDSFMKAMNRTHIPDERIQKTERHIRRTLKAAPFSFFSHSFRIEGPGFAAECVLDMFFESGRIRSGPHTLEVRKKGLLSGLWELTDSPHTIAVAHKASIFTRSFQIQSGDVMLELSATSPFTRTMSLQGPGYDCTFTADGPFTRRTTITGIWQDDAVMLFAFWLHTLMLRRRSNSNASAQTG